jgi:hypothetical protein
LMKRIERTKTGTNGTCQYDLSVCVRLCPFLSYHSPFMLPCEGE